MLILIVLYDQWHAFNRTIVELKFTFNTLGKVKPRNLLGMNLPLWVWRLDQVKPLSTLGEAVFADLSGL